MTTTELTQDQAKQLATTAKQIIRSCGYTDYDGSSKVMEVPITVEQLLEDLSKAEEWSAVQDSPDKFWIETANFGYEVLLVENCSGWVLSNQTLKIFKSPAEGYSIFKENARVCIDLTDKNGKMWGVTTLQGGMPIECFCMNMEKGEWEILI